jgi:uncharacterized low-complexity protein
MKASNSTLSLVIGGAFAASIAATSAVAAENPFALKPLSSGYMVADHHGEKDKEGRCGSEKKPDAKSDTEGKCGTGKCGSEMKSDKKTDAEGKCGAGKCGAEKK